MRVLIVNKFYYNRGGDCVVAINLREELKSRGYDVAVFTMDYSDNYKGDYIHVASEVSFKNGIKGKLQFVERMLGGYGVAETFKKTLRDFKPDVVHLHNVHSYLSPVVASLAKEAGCRVLWTMHDYKLICPAYNCLNHSKPCELCYVDKKNVLKHRCVKNSLAASVLAYIEAVKWNRSALERYVDAFVCPSQFLCNQMKKAGFSATKLHTICNFIDPIKLASMQRRDCTHKKPYYVYIGRLSEEKGVETLLKAAMKTADFRLKVVGDGPQGEYLRGKYKSDNIEYLGFVDAVSVSDVLEHAKLLVMPSEWYENNPLSVIEALCAGTPVVGARIGGIPELIDDSNGLVFEPGNCEELERCIIRGMESDIYDYAAIADAARTNFSANAHIKKLEELYCRK